MQDLARCKWLCKNREFKLKGFVKIDKNKSSPLKNQGVLGVWAAARFAKFG